MAETNYTAKRISQGIPGKLLIYTAHCEYRTAQRMAHAHVIYTSSTSTICTLTVQIHSFFHSKKQSGAFIAFIEEDVCTFR